MTNLKPILPRLRQSHRLAQGLVGAWTFHEGNGLTAHDLSGHGNDGTLTGGPTWTNGKRGGYALDFDGTDDYVDVGDDASLRGMAELTVSAWFAIDIVAENEQQAIVGYWGNASPTDSRKYLMRRNGANPDSHQGFIFTDDTGQIGGTFSEESIGSGVWHNIVMTWDGATLRMYVDGSDTGTTFSGNGNIQNTSQNNLWLGDDVSGSGDPLNGKIDDVRIYDRALFPDEIEETYQNPWGLWVPEPNWGFLTGEAAEPSAASKPPSGLALMGVGV